MGIEEFAKIAIPILVVAFFASIIPRKLNERQKFIEAAADFRKTFNKALVDIQTRRFGIIEDNIINTHRVAYRNFRPYLRGNYRHKYDEAWKIYCYDFEHGNAEKDIERLLTFTEYKILRDISFFVEKLWFRLRLKIFGPDKKTKELVEKFIKDYQDKTLLP